MTPEQHWNRFIARLDQVQPIKGERDKKTGKYQLLHHQNFLGSIEKYKKIFLEANQEQHEARPTTIPSSAP